MEFFMHVCINATACVCKTVQTLVFPDKLVNHIWGKNLDSFPPSFSAAFPFPHVWFPPSFPALVKRKKKKQKSASFIFSVLCPQANFSLVLEQLRGVSYFALITLVSAWLCFRSIMGIKGEGKRLAKSAWRSEYGEIEKQVVVGVKMSLFMWGTKCKWERGSMPPQHCDEPVFLSSYITGS